MVEKQLCNSLLSFSLAEKFEYHLMDMFLKQIELRNYSDG